MELSAAYRPVSRWGVWTHVGWMGADAPEVFVSQSCGVGEVDKDRVWQAFAGSLGPWSSVQASCLWPWHLALSATLPWGSHTKLRVPQGPYKAPGLNKTEPKPRGPRCLSVCHPGARHLSRVTGPKHMGTAWPRAAGV